MSRVWDVATGNKVLEIDQSPESVRGLAFSGDGRYLAVAGRRVNHPEGFRLLRIRCRGIRSLRGMTSPAVSVSICTHRRLLVALAEDMSVALWDLDSGCGCVPRAVAGHHVVRPRSRLQR